MVALEFFRRAAGLPGSLGVLPAAFNPPTRAHLTLARAALNTVDEVLFVLPRGFPHKSYEGANFDERRRMLVAAAGAEPRYSIAASEGGLFHGIAEECHEAYGAERPAPVHLRPRRSRARHRLGLWRAGCLPADDGAV